MKRSKKIIYVLLLLLALVLIGFYGLYVLKNAETKTISENDRKNAGGSFVKLTDGITHYEAAGPDTAKTIVLIHGFSVPYYIWDGTFDSLVHRGFRVIRYDEFGRGLSDKPNAIYSPLFYRKQLVELLEVLKVKTPFHIAGLSFGGAIVSDFVTHYPQLIDKIIFIDPVYRFPNQGTPEAVMNYTMAIKAYAMADDQLTNFKHPELFPNWASKYKPQMQFKGFRHALISTIKNYPRQTIIANYTQLDSFHKKVLLIWGKDDKIVTFDYSDSLRQKLNVDLLAVEDAGHLPHLEKPTIVNQKIISFLKTQ